jgi:hypothetical protein
MRQVTAKSVAVEEEGVFVISALPRHGEVGNDSFGD